MSDINIQDLKEQCERSFYKELYRDPSKDLSLVLEETSGRICVLKTLAVYNPDVYRWLKEHPHPHLPRIHMIREEAGKLTVIEEYIQGVTFDRFLSENSVSEERKLRLLLDLCGAVRHLHSAAPPIIHRDIKNSNIMITDDGILKLIDFDAAKLFHADESQDTVFMGTQGHAAPEQYGFGASDVRTDIYGLGILIRDLFPGKKRLQAIARKATMLKPEERYQSVGDLESDLEAFLKGVPAGTHGATRRLLPPPGFRTKTLWKEGIAVIGYLIIFTFSFSQRKALNETGVPLFLDQCAICAAFLTFVDIFFNWTGICADLPYTHSEKKVVRAAAYIAWCFIALLFWFTIAAFLQVFYSRITA